MKVVYSITGSHLEDVHKLYKNEWWTNTRTLVETKACIDGSQICIGLVNGENELIGFARVLTDYIFKALIFDVIVSPCSRKLGLGDELVSLILSHPDLSRIKSFELYCLPEMFKYYEKFGFSNDLGEIKLMRKVIA